MVCERAPESVEALLLVGTARLSSQRDTYVLSLLVYLEYSANRYRQVGCISRFDGSNRVSNLSLEGRSTNRPAQPAPHIGYIQTRCLLEQRLRTDRAQSRALHVQGWSFAFSLYSNR